MAEEDNQETSGRSGISAAVNLYELIGAPLQALVEAERYSAEATADFIKSVGFSGPAKESGQGNWDDLDEYGDLRLVSFNQNRVSPSGEVQSYEVRVPLLSILPIPAMQIQDAELEFFVKIVESIKTPVRPSSDRQQDDDGKKSGGLRRWLTGRSSDRLDLKATMGRGRPGSGSERQQSTEMQVRVKLRVAQADIPAGLARLFNLMEHSIVSTPKPETPEGEEE